MVFWFFRPFREAIAFLRRQITLPTESWRDLRDDEHDAFFTIAGMRADMLSDVRDALVRAISEGRSMASFQEDFDRIAEAWSGRNPWRSRLVFTMALRNRYAEGRDEYQLDPSVVRVLAYRQFLHGGSNHPRPHHLALDGLIFEAGQEPFPVPNGFGCNCRFVSLSRRQALREGLTLSTLKRGDRLMFDGQLVQLVPDPGFDYPTGQSRRERRSHVIDRVLSRQPEPMRRLLQAELNRRGLP